MIRVSQQFSFDSAHTLKRGVPLPDFRASMRVHGHTYFAEVTMSGELGPAGMLTYMEGQKEPGRKKAKTLDLFFLRKEIERVRLRLDHHLLDEVEGLQVPTLEALCVFIRDGIRLPLVEVSVWRADGGKATWRKE